MRALRRSKPTFEKPVFAQAYCPLEVLAEGTGATSTERLVSQSIPISKIGEALNALLDDKDGERAFKKALHSIIEERMRSMAVTVENPLCWGEGTEV